MKNPSSFKERKREHAFGQSEFIIHKFEENKIKQFWTI